MSGIFGVVSKKDCVDRLFCGVDYHSHLGTEYGGMSVLNDKGFYRQIHNITQSQFKSKFFDDYGHMRGSSGIGAISSQDEQPIYLNSRLGQYCVVTMGLIANISALRDGLFIKGDSFVEFSNSGVNSSELIAKLVSRGENIVDGIEKMFEVIEGSCSLLLLNKDGIYAARDRMGVTPLVIGRSEDAWAVTSETCAFPNNDFRIVKYLAPGEVVLLTNDGLSVLSEGNKEKERQICTFLWVYTGFPASSYEGINVEVVRERCGRALARRDKDIGIDIVSGVPDSGIAHAIGYAMESAKPYRRPLVKYTPGYGRSYIPPSQEKRDHIAKMKLIPVKEIINGNRIVVCEDSIVRGTQLKNFTIKKLWDNGAKEIHVRPACPPLMFPCRFNLSTRSVHELVARRAIRDLEGRDLQDISAYLDSGSDKYLRMVDWISKDLGVTTLRYQSLNDLIEAVGLPAEKLCTYCWSGGTNGCCRKNSGEKNALDANAFGSLNPQRHGKSCAA